MGSKIKELSEKEKLQKIREFILVEHNDIAKPLINDKVGKMVLKETQDIDGLRIYRTLVEIIECDPEDKEISRKNKMLEYVFDKGKIKSLAGYFEEKRIRARKRRKKVIF